MTRKIVALMFPVLLIIFVSGANAETITTTTSAQKATTTSSDIKNTLTAERSKADLKIKALRDEFQKKIQTIKDERKRALTQKIDTDIAAANAKHTSKFNEILAKLQGILDIFSLNAKDVKTVSDVKTAQDKIDAAKAAVSNQSAKVYTIGITTETRLKINVGTTVSQFRKDIMQVYKSVIDAKQAVQNLRGNGTMNKEATKSANL